MLNHKTANKAELTAHRALHREAAQAGKQQAKALRAAVAHWRAYCSPVRDASDLPLQSINLQEPFIAAMLSSLLPVMISTASIGMKRRISRTGSTSSMPGDRRRHSGSATGGPAGADGPGRACGPASVATGSLTWRLPGTARWPG